MTTPALVLWWVCILLESLILFRAVTTRILRTYPFFCVYLSCVLAGDVLLFWLYRFSTASVYRHVYWTKEFICVLAGYCVVVEIVQRALASCEGLKRFAAYVGLVVFAFIVGFTALQGLVQRSSEILLSSVEVERNLRSAELVFLALLVAMISYYGIPMGQDLKGIIIGYGLCVATVVLDHAVQSYAGFYKPIFTTVLSYSYLFSLLVWTFCLWSYHAHPVPNRPTPLDDDYDVLVNSTREAIVVLRGLLGKAARS